MTVDATKAIQAAGQPQPMKLPRSSGLDIETRLKAGVTRRWEGGAHLQRPAAQENCRPRHAWNAKRQGLRRGKTGDQIIRAAD